MPLLDLVTYDSLFSLLLFLIYFFLVFLELLLYPLSLSCQLRLPECAHIEHRCDDPYNHYDACENPELLDLVFHRCEQYQCDAQYNQIRNERKTIPQGYKSVPALSTESYRVNKGHV
jgi:hypothetical protein